MKKSIFKAGKKYTFSDYFELNSPTEEIVAELGYAFSYEVIHLPRSNDYSIDEINKLQQTLYTILPKIIINSEIAKREFLIAPILVEIAKNTASKINVEYALEVDDRLSGSLDYLIQLKQEIIVIEAKKGDLDKGFNQLSAELIALDKYEDDNTSNVLYGAISIGDVWKFGILKRQEKQISKDINSYTIPADIEKVFSILMGILTKT
ncbi:hypothetical protein [Candidatus Venteria ishoeyi]|uniref:Type I restriction enzyme R protein N-terminal domain-containing protein n=1 Tax=Candidatus Venteria ishoeyi TaxID=1899563 RepID=A0A1H6FGM1_9GAMM|nr:hypothetical protein [Candidatus Venteria ishoeyi]MDM8547423.1 hypothetical protein [Candidatus Venteria ishoeyi]SEH08803.1 Uncharacterised protein [Candidatus Venteria ishoeyi]